MNLPPPIPPVPGPGLDVRKIRRSFARAAGTFDDADFLQSVIRERLVERLELVRLDATRILDLGAGTGRATGPLALRFPGSAIIAVDLVPAMLQAALARAEPRPWAAICGDAARLPFADRSVDLVFSNLMIHWCGELDAVFAEVRRVLRYPGLFSFATLGPGSFRELRQAWATVDDGPHVMSFPGMRALGDGLLRAGLTEPVVDTEIVTINYRDLRQLTTDFRATGTTNPQSGRRQGLTGRAAWSRLQAAYDSMRGPDGRLPATLEIICGQAWVPADGQPRPGRRGETAIPLTEIRGRAATSGNTGRASG